MSIDHGVGTDLHGELSELRAALARHPFPTGQDDILALLVARHEPSRLLWRVGTLSRARVYTSADDVCDEIAAAVGTRMPPPPGR